MTVAPAVKPRPQSNLTVIRTEKLSEHMIRVIAGGAGFTDFQANQHTDQYVKIHFLQAGVAYPEPVDVFGLRESLPREQWPITRTYTIRRVDHDKAELAIDFVVHGDEGLAGPWAAAAQPGDRLIISGPGGGYSPDPAADWYLFAGDEAALPAIAASIEALPTDASGLAFIEVGNQADIQPIQAPADVEIRWIYRDGEAAGTSRKLVAVVSASQWPVGTVHAFVHGEREAVKGLRDVLFKERGLERNQVSISGYWAYGRSEDRFQAEKRDPIGKI